MLIEYNIKVMLISVCHHVLWMMLYIVN